MTRDRSAVGNPFPVEAVATTTIRGVPDYRETAAFRETWSIVENFIEDFPAPQTRAHVTLGLRGAYGSGKTHLLLQLLDSFTGGAPAYQLTPPDASGMRALACYVKVDQMQLMDLYVNQLMRHLELDDFRTIIASQLAKVLRSRRDDLQAQQNERSSLVEIASREIDGQLETNPQLILALLESDLVPLTGLAQSVHDDIRNSSADLGENFMRAYAHLTDHTLGPLALRWLKGQPLASGEMKDLGLSIPAIASPNHARTALRLLLTMLAKADVRLMLCLDEFERGALTGGDTEHVGAAAFVKDIAEICIDAKQCVVFCGVDDAWNAMTPDVFDRIRHVVTVQMSSEEVLAILGAYCAASSLKRDVLFGRDARTLLAEIASRSPRRLLTLAHHSYNNMQRRGGTAATVEDVRDAAERALETDRRRSAVLQVVRAAARQRGWDVVPDAPFGDSQVDLLLTKGERRVAIHILNSLFKLEELQDARTVANHTRRSAADRGRTAHVVIVTGYSTAEVRQSLNQLVDRVFWYEEGQFGEAFGGFLERGPESDPAAVRTELDAHQTAYQTLEHRLLELESKRQTEVDRLNELLSSMQSEMRRAREVTRDTRASDKIELTIEALRDLLDREQGRLDSKSTEPVHPILDAQRALVRRLLLLNEPLPEPELFEQVAKRLDVVIAEARPENIRERRDIVVHLESLHFARRAAMSMGRTARLMRTVRHQWALSAAVALTAIALVVFVYDVWQIRSEVAELSKHLNQLQRTAESLTHGFRLIEDDMYELTVPHDELAKTRTTAMTAISGLGDVMDGRPMVERVSPALGPPIETVRTIASDLVTNVRTGLPMAVSDAPSSPATQPKFVYSKETFELPARLISSCRAVRAGLAEVDLASVARRFYALQPTLVGLVALAWVLAGSIALSTRFRRLAAERAAARPVATGRA